MKKQLNMNAVLILLAIGLCAGFLSGMIGVGGGIIIVPALVYFMGMSQLEAQGTSLAVLLLPVGILAVYNYWSAPGRYVDVQTTLIIAGSFVVGGYIGSKISIGLDQVTVKRIFGIVMILVSLRMIFSK
jgi:uncharacterized membrane protein YfcA